MRWYLNPVNLARTAGDIKRVVSGGGPKSLRLTGIGYPRGIFMPRVPVSLEIVGRNGSRTAFEPELPVGLLAGYSFRIARLLHLPLIRDLDPRSTHAEVRIPGR